MINPARIICSQRAKENIALIIIVVLSGSYAFFTIVDAQFYVDEQTYARLGYSLLQGHLATTSSFYQLYYQLGYARSDLPTPFGSMETVEPFLDTPPLVSVLLVPVLLMGASPRLLPIVFSALTTFLIFFLLRGQRILAWASALVWTGFFVSHQILSMLFIDSGVAFFNLLTVTLTSEYARTRSRNYLYLAGVTGGLAALSKQFGIASLLFLLGYLIYSRLGLAKESIVKNSGPFLLAVGIALIWPLYGLATAAPLFIQLQQANASRSFLSGVNSNLSVLVSSFTYTQSTMYYAGVDVMLLIGWVGVAYSVSKRKFRLVTLSILTYLLVVLALRYAWFYTMIPLFPFFAIGLGTLATDLVDLVRRRLQPRFTQAARGFWQRLSKWRE